MSFFRESRVGGFIFWRFGLSHRIIVKMPAGPMEGIQNNVSLRTMAEETIGHQGMYNGNISWMETNLSKFGKQAMPYATGNRIAKIVSTPTKSDTTAYVRDASGNVLAVISDKVNLYGHNNTLDSARAAIVSASDYYPMVTEEQTALSGFMKTYEAKVGSKKFDEIIDNINKSLNSSASEMVNSYIKSAKEKIGGEIDFRNQSHREALGNTLVDQKRSDEKKK